MIFAREISSPLTSLVKKLDAATAANSSAKMGSFVVFCTDDEDMEKKLKELAKKEKVENTVLSIDNPAGPRGYKVAKEADVTVILYANRSCKSNFAFEKGKMTEKDVDAIVSDLKKILPKD